MLIFFEFEEFSIVPFFCSSIQLQHTDLEQEFAVQNTNAVHNIFMIHCCQLRPLSSEEDTEAKSHEDFYVQLSVI